MTERAGADRFVPWIFAIIASVLAAFASWDASPTNDEPTFIGQGAYLAKSGDFYAPVLLWQPPLALYVTSAALPAVDLAPGALESRPDVNSLTALGDRLLFASPSPPEAVLRASRLPVIVVFGLLAALAAWLAGRLGGPTSGILAGSLVAFSPPFFAHGGLATTDIVATTAALLAVTPLALAAARDSAAFGRRDVLVAGAALGAALLSKHTAIALVPVTFCCVWWLARRGGATHVRAAGAGVLAVLTAGIVVWAGYGFHFAPLLPPDSSGDLASRIGPQATWLERAKAELPVPAPRYWASVLFQASKSHGRLYFRYFDEISKVGWWTYFPVVTFCKLTLGSIVLLGCATWSLRGSRTAAWERVLLIAFAVPFAAAIVSRHNLGVRHVLPALAPLLVWTGARLGPWIAGSAPRVAWIGAMTILHLAEGFGAAPDGVAWWNLAAGGTSNGWRVAADSNMDWGQGLWRLRDEMKTRGISEMWLIAGSAGPASSIAACEKDGIRVHPDATRTAPLPATGWLAVSTSLWRDAGHAPVTDDEPEFTVAGCYRVYRLPLASRTR